MNNDQDLTTLMSEARDLRMQYIGGLLRNAWNAVVSRVRIFREQAQGVACPQ